jgi:hypothetical protein
VSLKDKGRQNRPRFLSQATAEREPQRQSDVDARERVWGEVNEQPTSELSDFDGAGALLRLKGYRIAQNRPSVDDPVGAADDREGVPTELRHVFVERRSQVGECRMDIRPNLENFGRRLSDQMGEKRSRVFRRRASELRIDVFGILLDGEEDLISQAEYAVGKGNFIGGDFKKVNPCQAAVLEGWAPRGRADLAEPVAFQTSIERRAAQLGHQTPESHKGVIEREAGAPAVGENDRFVLEREKFWTGIFRAHSLVGDRLARFPFGDRLAVDAIPPGQNRVCLVARLDRAPDFWGRLCAAVRPSRRLLT